MKKVNLCVGKNLNEFSQIISAYVTVVLAFLTAAYVSTTNRQLSVMQKQLSEMAKGRELANQPLPYLSIEKVS